MSKKPRLTDGAPRNPRPAEPAPARDDFEQALDDAGAELVLDVAPLLPAEPSEYRAGKASETPVSVAELVADPRNRRRHTTRNLEMITASLRDVGAARSIVIDERNEILAGNGLIEAAGALGLSRVQVIDVDGDTIVAVRRSGLTDEQKRALAIFDNRSAELAEWNPDQLAADVAAGFDFAPFFTEAEIGKILGPVAPESFKTVDINVETHYRCPSCGYAWSGTAKPAHADAHEPAP